MSANYANNEDMSRRSTLFCIEIIWG